MTSALRFANRVAAAVVLAGCGARTPLSVPGPTGSASDDSGPGASDASVDSGPLAESGPCGSGPSYVLDGAGVLYRYDVTTGHATPLGTPDCGNSNVQWTMTATRDRAYIAYTDGTLYVVDLATLVCTQTPFRPGQLGLDYDFGIAVSGAAGAEQLFVYGLPESATSPILAVSDLTSFVLTKVGDVLPAPSPSMYPVNLTADPMGNLYAFSPGGLRNSTPASPPTSWRPTSARATRDRISVDHHGYSSISCSSRPQIDPGSGMVRQSVQTGITSMGTWATLATSSGLYLWVQSDVDGYDLATRAQTSERDVSAEADILAYRGPTGGPLVPFRAGALRATVPVATSATRHPAGSSVCALRERKLFETVPCAPARGAPRRGPQHGRGRVVSGQGGRGALRRVRCVRFARSRTSPKDARVEIGGWTCARTTYCRVAMRGVLQGLTQLFCERAYVREVPALGTRFTLGAAPVAVALDDLRQNAQRPGDLARRVPASLELPRHRDRLPALDRRHPGLVKGLARAIGCALDGVFRWAADLEARWPAPSSMRRTPSICSSSR